LSTFIKDDDDDDDDVFYWKDCCHMGRVQDAHF